MNDLHTAMADAGLIPHSPIAQQPDGRMARFRVEGDKAGSKNGWLIRYSHPTELAVFGSWKTGVQHTWRPKSSTVTSPADRAEIQRQLAELRRLREVEQQQVHAAARDKAARLWARAHPADSSHPYLIKKRIKPFGLRRLRDMLVIPARDTNGTLHTIQFIQPDGSKRFLTGGRISGCYFSIGRPEGSILICEGVATAATLFEATGRAVAACFSAGNMVQVAQALRAKFPNLRFVLCGDNDVATPGNPGRTAAEKAARAVGGVVALPCFGYAA